jgi:hypothetical protein
VSFLKRRPNSPYSPRIRAVSEETR